MQEQLILGKEVINKIKSANYEAYFVGGCVRDLLLGRPLGDIDIATSAKPTEIIELFENVIPIGIEHGTVLVRYKKTSFEVTTFRLDGTYSDQRHPDSVQYIDRIDEDLKRRDFTINALAMDENDQIIDLFQGKEDLHKRVIRTVGDGFERFTEDPLRIIRALRFSSQLGFDIEEKTLTHMIAVKAAIETIAIERITAEMTKFFAGNDVQKGMDYLIRTNVFKYLPIFKEEPSLITLLPDKMKALDSFSEVIALLHWLQPNRSISQWSKAWKCSNKIRREATELIHALQYYKDNGINEILIYELPNHLFAGFIRLCELIFSTQISIDSLIKMYEQLPIQSRKDLQISGQDLISLYPNVRQGPWINQMLTEITELVLLSTIQNKQQTLKEWAICNPPEPN